MDKSVILMGITTGGIVKAITGNLYLAILTALCTGAAAYIGQQIMKYVHKNYIIKIRKK
jgi:hypothetical protein